MKTHDAAGLPLILQPFRPQTGGWMECHVTVPPGGAIPYVIEKWYSRAHELQVISAIEVVVEDSTIATPPRAEYHVSVSGLKWLAPAPYRVSESRARFALKCFGFSGYTQDNHVEHGIARNYWRPVADRFAGQICACVKDEPAMREMKGDYIWRGQR